MTSFPETFFFDSSLELDFNPFFYSQKNILIKIRHCREFIMTKTKISLSLRLKSIELLFFLYSKEKSLEKSFFFKFPLTDGSKRKTAELRVPSSSTLKNKIKSFFFVRIKRVSSSFLSFIKRLALRLFWLMNGVNNYKRTLRLFYIGQE